MKPSLWIHGLSSFKFHVQWKKLWQRILFVWSCYTWPVFHDNLFSLKGLVLATTVGLQNENYFLQQVDHEDHPLQSENRRFTYMELQKITNNFNHIIGKGGFGNVFHGYLENGTQVAVKTRSQSSTQGTKEFLAEVTDSNVINDTFALLIRWL